MLRKRKAIPVEDPVQGDEFDQADIEAPPEQKPFPKYPDNRQGIPPRREPARRPPARQAPPADYGETPEMLAYEIHEKIFQQEDPELFAEQYSVALGLLLRRSIK